MSKQKSRSSGLDRRIVLAIVAILGIFYLFGGRNTEVGQFIEEVVAILLEEEMPADNRPVEVSAPQDWYTIYFTQPTCPPFEERVGGLDEDIAADLRTAQQSVAVGAFDLDAEPLVDALIELEARGVPVYVVTDTDNGDLSSIRRLRRGGISVVEDERSGLMHDKFIVIDGRYVWAGSLNFTTNGIYCNNNNLVRFDAPALAANYSAELNEMYNLRSFGPRSPDATPNERISIHGVEVENYFGPERRLAPIVAELIASAEEEVLVMAFSFTSDIVGEALLERAQRGVEVRTVFETTGSETEYSYYSRLLESNLPNVHARQDGNPRIMHHKVVIVDGRRVLFGSFNFSNNANDSNDENIVIVHDFDFTLPFVEEFERVWNAAQ